MTWMPNFWEILKKAAPEAWALALGLFKLFIMMIKPIWPLIVIVVIFVIVRSRIEKKLEEKELNDKVKKCPDCAELIPKEAKKCSHCGKTF